LQVNITCPLGVTTPATTLVITTLFSLRQRQDYAITGIELLCLLSAVIGGIVVVAALRGARLRRGIVAALAVCSVVAISVIVVQPVDHLNNRFTGWLSDEQ
jgi:hypothetical protein